MNIEDWIFVASSLPPELRAYRYETWRSKKVMPEEHIAAIEKQYPPPSAKTVSEPQKGVGLGDAIKAVTDFLHIPQCGGCAKRQEALNKIRIG